MSEDVLVGKEGWLFLSGGSNTPIDYFLNKAKLDSSLSRDWCDILQNRRNRLGTTKYFHLIAPNKETIYDHKTGLTLPQEPGNPLSFLYRSASAEERIVLNEICINPINFFRRIRDDVQLYWKTDSHWNFNGCFAAYQLICSALDIQPLSELLSRPFVEGTITLDLGAKLTPPHKETVRFYQLSANSKRTYANDLVEFKEKNNLENEPGLHVGCHVKFMNPNAKHKLKMMIFGDSFSEYRPSLLTGMFAETMQETHFVWSTSLDYALIKRVSPDIVLTEIAERFLPSLPNDGFDVVGFSDRRIQSHLNCINP